MEFIEKVGNIKVYVERNAERDITVKFYNGSDCVMSEVYFTSDISNAVENLFQKLDTYTMEYLTINAFPLTKESESVYRCQNDYFKRYDDTRFYKHFNHKVA